MLELRGNSNYCATVTTLGKPRQHSNADRLQCWTVFGQSIITDLTYKSGDLVIYFPAETKISGKFLSSLNLFRDKELNSDKSKTGYFEQTGRIKALKLRGEWSTGLVIPASSVSDFYQLDEVLTPGASFDQINGEEVCGKYYPRLNPMRVSRQGSGNRSQRRSIIVPGQFAFHLDTANLGRCVHNLKETVFELREKYHGTSLVVSNILTKRKLSWFEKILQKFGVEVKDSEYGIIYSSRKVVKNDFDKEERAKNNYYDDDIWGLAVKKIDAERSLEQGITLYAEIVGYLPNGSHIQGFGGKAWDYGCDPGTFRVVVYRITYTTQNGSVIEFTPDQIDSYCQWKGLERAEYVGQLTFNHDDLANDVAFDSIRKLFCTGPCKISKSGLPREGVVARVLKRRVEAGQPMQAIHDWQAYKIKSFEFLELESRSLDNTWLSNIEDQQEEEV
jgi:hypothetical protein